jgi:hypothetical protein
MTFSIKLKDLILFANPRGYQDLRKTICNFLDRRQGLEEPMFLPMVEIKLVQQDLSIEQVQVLVVECQQEQFQAN